MKVAAKGEFYPFFSPFSHLFQCCSGNDPITAFVADIAAVQFRKFVIGNQQVRPLAAHFATAPQEQ